MKVLITGGAGFIGSHLCDRLVAAGHRVTAIDDLSTGRLENIAHLEGTPGFQFVHETIMHEAVMDRLVSECDAIYHLASAVGVELIVSRPVEVIERCILGTELVLKTAHRYKKRVLLTSTSEVYGKNSRVPFSEDDDRLLGRWLASRVPRMKVIDAGCHPAVTLAVFELFSAAVCMRYHSFLFADRAGTPIVGVPYAAKCERWMADHGLRAPLPGAAARSRSVNEALAHRFAGAECVG